MSQSLLQRQDHEGVATLTLSRPDAYNSLSLELMQALHAELDIIAEDVEVRCVVVRGAGKGFCAGHDLKQMLGEGEEDYYRCTFETCSKLMQRIVSLPVPVIAQVHGVATAAGCQLVASADLAVAADTARFATPGVNIGLFCSTPMVALSRAVQPKHAMELLLTGELINAQRAFDIGLINQQVAEEELDQTVNALASKIASKSRKALQIGKQAFYRQREMPLADAYALCSEVMVGNMLTDDAQEGIDAFINKRKPQWKHR
ncbi:enoyl-CoA hydratase [Marinobacterium sediminicola]|uniref:Enoyl-CoA hydratase domain-containing protein 3, mitochondrial n=1 Tax=Marinobacterium sediminicola TaxID=518898 RepID=A0ABY1RYX1_9GAMM|nr:enoyl-CoA hydratase [Marinobacterium sediminicola]ULG67992.1 enoyl-CoA hydratase [Marinobacterium sediminicola]SMR73499.1 Enoyl-CoA hydratase/carnithine racemase [Marinobacterium sediminicola]